MKNLSEYSKFSFIGLCLIVFVYFLPPSFSYKASSAITDLAGWYIYKFSRKSVKNLKLIGIAVDENSLARIPERWPWQRAHYAKIIRLLDEEKVHTIGLDFTFVGDAQRDDDLVLKKALEGSSCRVVLAYFFDPNKGPVLPSKELRESAYILGMVNTPQEPDLRTRRLRSHIKLGEDFYYSFPVALAASYLNQPPHKIISDLPLLKDRTFFINYVLRPEDIIKVSFIDVLENLEGLKKKYGNDFLKGSLAVVYPAAQIFHDEYITSLGHMSGGMLHLNGAANIILAKSSRRSDFLSGFFLLISLLLLAYFFSFFETALSLLLSLGAFILIFWSYVFLSLQGINFDLPKVVFFSILFLGFGNAYRYFHFASQLLRIKHKATIDPLRNLFTLRYFYYRLKMQLNRIYFGKSLFLVFIHLGGMKRVTDESSLDLTKDIWKKINLNLKLIKNKAFWSVYSPEEIVGCVVSRPSGISPLLQSLKNDFTGLLSENGIKSQVKLGFAGLKKNYPLREMISSVSQDLKNNSRDLVSFKEEELMQGLATAYSRQKGQPEFIESLDEDIEEKNRQLLSLLENLNKEYAKTKDLYFQIIVSLVNALDARDPYTLGHSERVCNYALLAADRLGWDEERKEKLKRAALLHDIGKIGIPDAILHKKGKLTEEEWVFIKKHELIGVKILEPIKEINDILPWIMYHHERWDGTGYPHGIAGEAIPKEAQLIALADSFDAMTTGRDYKSAFSRRDALNEIIKNKGTQYDPGLADIFVEAVSG